MIKNNKKVAIFGGSFNPIHNDHICIINYLSEVFDEVIVIPANISPHKIGTPPEVTNYQRHNMVWLSIKTIPNAYVSDFELNRKKVSYTVETVQHFKGTYPNLELVIGYDQYLNFTKWTEYRRIIDMVPINVIYRGRSNSSGSSINSSIFNFISIPDMAVDLSSTKIRENIKNNKSIREMVPKSVEKYIKNNNLYL